MPWTGDWATHRTVNTRATSAAWKWCSPMATWCAPAWAQCPMRPPGSCTSTATGPPGISCSGVEMDGMEGLGPLIDTIGPLRREGVLAQSPTIGNWFRAANILTTRKQWTDKPGSLSDDVISAIRKQFGLGWWGVSLRIYGRETVVQANLDILEK